MQRVTTDDSWRWWFKLFWGLFAVAGIFTLGEDVELGIALIVMGVLFGVLS